MVGTGDLSELALGWATYNGDHMSDVRRQRLHSKNVGPPPKSAMSPINLEETLRDVLTDILDTPVSPELLSKESVKSPKRPKTLS